jgi:hypothetical protein
MIIATVDQFILFWYLTIMISVLMIERKNNQFPPRTYDFEFRLWGKTLPPTPKKVFSLH